MTTPEQGERLFAALADRFPASEIPALTAQLIEWRTTRPLQGLRVLDATPLFFNTCVKHAVLMAGGADLSVAYCSQLPFDRNAVDLLNAHGVPVRFQIFDSPDQEAFDVILDCGAIHRMIPSRFGVAELTRSGVHYYENDAVRRNVYLTDSGTVKMIETCLGTGESCLRALRHLGYGPFEGKNVLIFGSGKVGGGIAMYFRRERACVTVADDPSRVPGTLDFHDLSAVRQAIRSADYVITATGLCNAHAACGSDLAASKAVLVNMGVEDEFGPDVPASRVLNRKNPLNFLLEEPTKTRYIDPTMALDNAAVSVLINTPPGKGLIFPDRDLEMKILDDVRRGGVITDE